MLLTFSLLGLALAITGLMGFTFFWPLTMVHLRDRHPAIHAQLVEAGVVSPPSLRWLLTGRYREPGDPGLNGLGRPARFYLVALLIGLANAGVFGLLAWILKP